MKKTLKGMSMAKKVTQEELRLSSNDRAKIPDWKLWGPYVSERAWGTVREDYSSSGDAWNFFTHDMARSKAYRWGEDGLAGFSDYYQTIVFALALWNGKDPILKERLFGLTPFEGNHGEDVKECYYYLDATPTHSYMKYLYKYPQVEFPYDDLVAKNKARTEKDREYELYDTGAFAENRYFDVFVEYAKNAPGDIFIRVQVFNRGPEPATIHILPHLWYRNTWGWKEHTGIIPEISIAAEGGGISALYADSSHLPPPSKLAQEYVCPSMYLYGSTPDEILFTNNESHAERLWGPEAKSQSPFVKDAFHRYLIQKEQSVNTKKKGTKACFHYGPISVGAGECHTLLFRLSDAKIENPFKDAGAIFSLRKSEADEFYEALQAKELSKEDKLIQRTAFAGMIWSKQFYYYNVHKWLKGDNPLFPPPEGRGLIRNERWKHLYAFDVFSMPDKWEYPWFAAWDLVFHTVTFSLIDLHFAKKQLQLLLTDMYQHANGQIPAYEWGFSDLNPPVQAWAFWKIYQEEERQKGKGDRDFLLWGFLKVMHNFDWWVNKVDKLGNNFFEGGFLGLDNISIIDRSKPLEKGGVMEQSDGTGWMGFYCLVLMRMALELAKEEPVYEGMATTFFEQFVYIASTMHEKDKMWDEEDGFFYDIILYPNGEIKPLKIRSFVGLIPFYSLFSIDEKSLKKFDRFYQRMEHFSSHNRELVQRCVSRVSDGAGGEKILFTMMNLQQIKRVLGKVFDPKEFLSEYGLRSVSKYHQDHPYVFNSKQVCYEPGESFEKIKGGNSNWRGPIWFPTNFLFLDALEKLSLCVGDDFQISMPDGSQSSLKSMTTTLKESLVNLFRKDGSGHRPVHGEFIPYAQDPFWNELVLFYEHYHGDTGRGLGASHQTGWSGLVANVIDLLLPKQS